MILRPAITPEVWRAFNAPLEGDAIPYMYLDVLGLVTTGMGNLIDPVSEAVKLPWRTPGGELATQARIASEWRALKARQDLAHRHHKYAARVTTVRLRPEDIAALIARKLEANAQYIQRAFADFASWPADAQLATMSNAWAMGPGFYRGYPSWSRAARARDWLGCAAQCAINPRPKGKRPNPGVIPRNNLNYAHFAAAAMPGDPGALRGPCTLDRLDPWWIRAKERQENGRLFPKQ